MGLGQRLSRVPTYADPIASHRTPSIAPSWLHGINNIGSCLMCNVCIIQHCTRLPTPSASNRVTASPANAAVLPVGLGTRTWTPEWPASSCMCPPSTTPSAW